MNREIWQQLLSLESIDLCRNWYRVIHGRDLNARRAKEINSAAKQSREYFRNSSQANHSVRPLLTFYGVASLSRSLLLLFKRDGGEEGLNGGHGLQTVDWVRHLSGEPNAALRKITELQISTCSGLFSDFIKETKNRMSFHINSSAVDWRLCYNIPDQGGIIVFGDLLSRIPDLEKDYVNVSDNVRYSPINEMSFSQENGFRAKVLLEKFNSFQSTYVDAGYNVDIQDKWCILSCDADTFSTTTPQFIHSYVQKTFGSIPNLHIADLFECKFSYSQLCITYLTSYFLGMLVRYFPTHWMALVQGGTGDALWPTINRAQEYIEESYPELVIEMIYDALKVTSESSASKGDN